MNSKIDLIHLEFFFVCFFFGNGSPQRTQQKIFYCKSLFSRPVKNIFQPIWKNLKFPAIHEELTIFFFQELFDHEIFMPANWQTRQCTFFSYSKCAKNKIPRFKHKKTQIIKHSYTHVFKDNHSENRPILVTVIFVFIKYFVALYCYITFPSLT